MKDSIYKELFTLVRQEGERLVVINPETDDGVVVMRLSEFKRLTEGIDEPTVVPVIDENEKKEPTLAKNRTEDLSFWDAKKVAQSEQTQELDNSGDSGRIIERKNANASSKEPISEAEADSAGEEYYFEPAEEIGL